MLGTVKSGAETHARSAVNIRVRVTAEGSYRLDRQSARFRWIDAFRLLSPFLGALWVSKRGEPNGEPIGCGEAETRKLISNTGRSAFERSVVWR